MARASRGRRPRKRDTRLHASGQLAVPKRSWRHAGLIILVLAAVDIADAAVARFEFKIVGVEPAGDGFTTRQHFSLSGATDRGVVTRSDGCRQWKAT